MKVSLKTVGLALLLLVVLFFVFKSTSGYMMVGSPVQTNISDSQFSNFFSRLTNDPLGPQLKCNPGSADKDGKVMSSYYTGGLLPGGYCDDQKVVSEAINYKLVGVEPALGD